MIKKLFPLILLTFLFASCGAQDTEGDLIRESFENYKTAILNDKGEDAVKCVDSRTIKYYSDILEKTKYADSAQVNALSLMDKVVLFTIRHRATKEQIMSFDGTKLFVYAIEEGMVGKNSVMDNTIGEVEVSDTYAKAQLVSNGEPTPFYMSFYFEEDSWKVDLTSMFSIGSEAFIKIQEDSGLNENEYVFGILEMLTGTKPGNEIWNKVIE